MVMAQVAALVGSMCCMVSSAVLVDFTISCDIMNPYHQIRSMK